MKLEILEQHNGPMAWTALTKENKPSEEVLALGYQNNMLVGHIDRDLNCYAFGGDTLREVSHFILIKDLLMLPKSIGVTA
jgi:hypothetical protein